MNIVITGGTGFVGRPLCATLVRAGHRVRVTSRAPARAASQLPGEIEVVRPSSAGAWVEAMRGADAVINLAGESIADGRWTARRKQALRQSRILMTRSIVDACRDLGSPPPVLVSASAIGYYGPHGDELIDETAPPGSDFLAQLCVDWESEALRAAEFGMRVVLPRIGVVLGDGGGALQRMVPPFRAFVGGPLGNGRQWMSWVHRLDVVALLVEAIENERMFGPINATAPDPRTMRDFSRALGAALRRPSWIPVPALALRIALGEMAGMLLTGQRVVPAAAEAAGFRFCYPILGDALAEILHR